MKQQILRGSAGLALVLSAAALVPHTAAAAATGSVDCSYGNNAVSGVWVEAGSRSGWANLRDNGYGGKYYALSSLPAKTRYRLHVGCGGTPSNWGAKFYTPYVISGSPDWACAPGYGCIES